MQMYTYLEHYKLEKFQASFHPWDHDLACLQISSSIHLFLTAALPTSVRFSLHTQD